MKVKAIILFLLSVSSSLHGQTEFKFKYITVDQGLSSNRVFSVYRDSRQFLWIGTDMGLNKYDGYQTTKYLSDGSKGSLSNNSLRCVMEDAEGNIWAGTADGLNMYNRATDSFIVFKYDSTDENTISSDNINSMYKDKAGTLWIFAGGNCLNKWVPGERKFIRYQFKGNDNAYYNASNSIAEDSKGNIWVGSYVPGLFCLKPNADSLIHFHDSEINFGDRDTKSLYIDEHDIVWIASNGSGFHSFDPSTGLVEHFPQNENGKGPNQALLRWIIPEDERFLLVAANQGGINRFDKVTKTFEYITYNPENGTGINNNGVWTFHRDREGILWIGTGNGGVNYYNPKEYNFKVYSQGYDKTHSPSSNTIGGFYEDAKGMIWVATDGEGINVYNPQDESFKVFKHDSADPFSVSGNTIRNIIEDDHNNLWIATWDAGLNRYDRATGKFYRFEPDGAPASISGANVWQVKMDHRGLFWLSIIEEGIDILDRERGVVKRFTIEPHGMGNDVAWQFFEDQDMYMWICTWKGLYRYEFETEKFTEFKNFPDNDIRTMYKDTKGNYWLGSFNQGLFKIDFNGNILKVYNDKNGLPNNQIHAIVEDEVGDLWISTNYGISHFNPQRETFKNYFKDDGLQGNQFFTYSFLKSRTGKFYFGGFDGFISFYPSELKINDEIPPIYFTSFEIFNREIRFDSINSILPTHISQASEISIPWDQNVFSLEFTAINYTFSQKNQYAYMLEGFDKEWNYEGTKRKVTYTNLDPGEYTFRVKASNNDGVWNENGATLVIKILPPWWKTSWFRAAYIFLIFLSIVGVYNIRTKQVRLRNQKLKHKVLQRSKELSEEKKRSEEIQQMNDALELEKQMLFQLMEYFPDRITFKDTLSRMTRVNTAKANRFNLKAEDFIGKTDFDLFPSDHADMAFNLEQRIVKSGEPDLNREECLSYGDDRLWWSLTSRIPLKNHENEVIGILVITKDITQLKLAEKSLFERTMQLERSKGEIEGQNRLLLSQQEELAAQNEELIQTQEEISAQRDLVAQQNDSLMEAQRIIELQNENLEQEVSDRTKELVEYNHQLEQFAFISAHNLRAPVARILGLGQILELAKDNQEEKDQIYPKLIFTARELDEVVRDLNSILDLKRNSDSFITNVGLASEILMVRGNLEREISASQADIIVDFSKVDTIRTVKPYLDSVFYNLISNAIKYRHPDRHPVIHVSTERHDDEVCLSVSDNGLGIDLNRFRDKVFNLYSRFHNHVEGKGMGLYLVKAQLTSLGGRVEIDSEVGEGTTFRVYFKITNKI